MNQLETQKHIVLMKSGIAHFVEKVTAERISDGIVNQTSHRFMKITEIDQVINTAEIEGVYTPETYSEYLRLKSGEFKCAYGKWHKKGDTCECKRDIWKENEIKRQARELEREYAPLTKEEREKQIAIMEKILKERPLGSRAKAYAGLKRSALNEYEKKFGRPYTISSGTPIIEDVL